MSDEVSQLRGSGRLLVRAADRLADQVERPIERRVIDARSEAADALLDYNSAANQPHREQFRARAARTRDVMITADDFAFETTFVPAGTGTGRLYTSTLTGPHGSAFASCDTAAQAVTHAAAAYETRFLDAGMVPEAR